MKLIDKAAVVAEIEKRIKEISQIEKASYEIGLFDAYKIVLRFLDTLEIKDVQEEHVCDDLEGAAIRYAKEEYNYKNHATLPDRCRGCYAPLMYAFKAGAEWQKEQLMKDSVYGLVCGHDESSPAWIDLNLLNKPNVKVGTEIKLIIIKD